MSGSRHVVGEPVDVLGEPGVDSGIARFAALVPERDDADLRPPAGLAEHERPPRVPLAGVLSTLLQPCADEVLVDRLEVGLVTVLVPPDWDLHLPLHLTLLPPCKQGNYHSNSLPSRH